MWQRFFTEVHQFLTPVDLTVDVSYLTLTIL